MRREPIGRLLQVLIMFMGLACSLGGCNTQDEVGSGDSTTTPLTGEKSRAALIAMVEAGKYEELKLSLPNLRTDAIEQVDEDVVTIGKWQCDLKAQMFLITVNAGPIFAEYQGEFARVSESTWKATITSVQRN